MSDLCCSTRNTSVNFDPSNLENFQAPSVDPLPRSDMNLCELSQSPMECGGRECQRATSGNFGVSEISETPPGSRSSGFSDIRVLGAPGSRISGFSELRVLGADVAKSTFATYTSKKRPNINKRQEYVATVQSLCGEELIGKFRYCQHWKRFVVERCV